MAHADELTRMAWKVYRELPEEAIDGNGHLAVLVIETAIREAEERGRCVGWQQASKVLDAAEENGYNRAKKELEGDGKKQDSPDSYEGMVSFNSMGVHNHGKGNK